MGGGGCWETPAPRSTGTSGLFLVLLRPPALVPNSAPASRRALRGAGGGRAGDAELWQVPRKSTRMRAATQRQVRGGDRSESVLGLLAVSERSINAGVEVPSGRGSGSQVQGQGQDMRHKFRCTRVQKAPEARRSHLPYKHTHKTTPGRAVVRTRGKIRALGTQKGRRVITGGLGPALWHSG